MGSYSSADAAEKHRQSIKSKQKGQNIMKKNKMEKRKFTKRTAAAIMIAMLVAAGCIGSASAAVESWNHTISCSATGSTSFNFVADHDGTRSDSFGSYPTIYNGKDKTVGKCRVEQNGIRYREQEYCLYANQASRPTYYFGKVPKGPSLHYYKNTSGGFKSSLTTTQTY